MNPEVQVSTRLLKVIGKHVDELDGCRHSIVEIMKEVFETEDKRGIRPTTGEHQTSNFATNNNGFDIDSIK